VTCYIKSGEHLYKVTTLRLALLPDHPEQVKRKYWIVDKCCILGAS